MIDIIALAIVFMLFQLPGLWLVSRRDKVIAEQAAELRQLRTALLRAERPEVARLAEARPAKDPEPVTEEQRIQSRARAHMFKP